MAALYRDIELPLCPVLYSMEKAGVLIDRQQLEQFGQKLSERIAYPITVGNTTYEYRNCFLAIPFEVQLSDGALEAIRAEKCTNMFCNYAGIMMGDGEVWIAEVLNADLSSAGLKIIGLNIS